MTKLWFVRRTDRFGYDEYDSFVCAADTYEQALYMHPNEGVVWDHTKGCFVYKNRKEWRYEGDTWRGFNDVIVEYLGYTDREIAGKIICASFNAG